jgi:indole-3-glycerol phosphate synthase
MSILEKIIEHKKMEIAALNAQALHRAAEESPAPRDFLSPIKRRHNSPRLPGEGAGVRLGLIAELKRASPSKGILAPHLDLFQVADIYAQNGASAISVLTDEKFFMGKLETLRELRFTHKSELPLLRKDFIIDESQIFEARANGADAVLLIAAAIPDVQLFADLHAAALELGLTALVEVHDEAETERALKLKDVKLIGINNRNLATFDVTLETTEHIRPMIPSDITVVAESGIFNGQDVERLAEANVDAILVGEALVTSDDIGAKVRELSGFSVIASPSIASGEAISHTRTETRAPARSAGVASSGKTSSSR